MFLFKTPLSFSTINLLFSANLTLGVIGAAKLAGGTPTIHLSHTQAIRESTDRATWQLLVGVPRSRRCRVRRAACVTTREQATARTRYHQERDGPPQTTFQSVLLVTPPRRDGTNQSSSRICHVVKAHVHSDAVMVRVSKHQVRVDSRVDRKNNPKDGHTSNNDNLG